MPDPTSQQRAADRRGGDRRNNDRRTPVPVWRRPAAYVAYGILAALAVVVLLRTVDGDDPGLSAEDIGTATAPPAVDSSGSPAAEMPTRVASGAGEFERLLAEGDAAVGQRVATELLCEPVSSITLVPEKMVHASVAALADASSRVPAAECTWGSGSNPPDFLLLVPAELAPRFASVPEVQQGFVRRRRVQAELEWIGRSEALSLQNVGVLRQVGGR